MKKAHADVEVVREKLKKLGRAKCRELAATLELSPASIDKFRRGWITEPNLTTVKKLQEALEAV